LSLDTDGGTPSFLDSEAKTPPPKEFKAPEARKRAEVVTPGGKHLQM
jgi:hypothetical protein